MRVPSRLIVVSAALLFLASPSSVYAAYTSTKAVAPGFPSVGLMTGNAAGDTLTITQAGGLFQHNRFTAGDPGFNSNVDFDTTVAGDQTLSATADGIVISAGDGNDVIALGDGINLRGGIDGGPGTDTLDYSASTTAVRANLGLNTSGLAATLGADQENPPTTHIGTGTATVTNYNQTALTFDIAVTVTGITPAEVTGFHIHQGVVGVNGPIIVDFTGLPLVLSGTGFTFTATGLPLLAVNEAAFLGGGTYVNVHTAVFPGGAIRGQLYSGANANLTIGEATGTTSIAGLENVTGGAGNDSLVGSSAVNLITGGAGADWIVAGAGNDTLSGGAGADVLVWSNGDGTDVDEGGTEADIVQVNGNITANDVFTVTPNGTRLRFDRTSPGPFSLDIGTVETLIVNGIGGNDSFTVGDLTGVATLATLNLNGGDGDDTFTPASAAAFVFSAKGGPGTDTIDYTAHTTAVTANLGLNTTGLAATLGGDQENPPTTHTATGTATVTNYNIVTHTFDIAVTVTGITPAEVTGFHIHQGVVGLNGPIIVNFAGVAPLVPVGTGFTFTAPGLVLPAASEAAFLGGGTYVNVHTAVFPGGAIRGQLFSAANAQLGLGAGTGTAGPAGAGGLANIENVTGGSGNDSLVGSFGVNTINGGAGGDWIVGGPGNDTLNGGAGADVLVWSNGDGTDVDEGGADSDTVQVNGNTANADVFVVAANGTRVKFDRTNVGLFSLDIGTVETLIVNGIGGDDSFTVNSLTGVASLTATNLFGFAGNDIFSVKGSATVALSVRGGAGTDTLSYDAETRTVSGDFVQPDGNITSPGVQAVTFTQVETVAVTNTPPATIAISDVRVVEGGVPTSAVFNVTLSNGSTQTVTVNFATANGTATAPGDYTARTGTVTFMPGETLKTVAVPIALDAVPEPSETFFVNLSGAVNATIADAQGQATITEVTPAGDFDGDRKADLVVFRPASGNWFTLPSATSFSGGTVNQFGLNGDVPVPGDYDRDGKIDLAVFRPSDTTWYIRESSSTTIVTYTFGLGTDIPVAGDYDGDQKTDPAVYHPSTGVWSVLTSGGNYTTPQTFTLGAGIDVPVPADYDGDAITDVAVFHPATGVWTILTSRSGFTSTSTFQWGQLGDVPVPGDYDGDRLTDIAVYRRSNGVWFFRQSTTSFTTFQSFQFGLSTDIPVPSDYDGDGKTDLAVWRQSNGTWFISPSTTGYATAEARQWGQIGDLPIPNSNVLIGLVISRRTVANTMRTGDVDGDGRADLTVFRPSTGTWFNLRSNTNYTGSAQFQWGTDGDVPAPSDYDGDGVIDLAVWRPSTGTWFIKYSSTNFTTDESFQWGQADDLPLPGDFDGDGRADLVVWRPSSGVWFIRLSSTNYTLSTSFQWGQSGDAPVPGDYDGDGVSDLAVWRSANGTWFIRLSSTGFASIQSVQWGSGDDIAVPGDYDSDGRTDIAVFRPSTGTWFILTSSTNYTGFASYQWGANDDLPVPADFDGDGKTDLAVYRESIGTWFLLKSSSNFTSAAVYQWGTSGDFPILRRK